jgi:hypothetical protein
MGSQTSLARAIPWQTRVRKPTAEPAIEARKRTQTDWAKNYQHYWRHPCANPTEVRETAIFIEYV